MQKKQIHEGHLKRYQFAKALCQNQDVLDVACGFGTGADLLAQSSRSVDGVDLDPEELAHATHFYKRDNLRFHQMDGTKMSFPDNSFDAVVSFETLEHLSGVQQELFLQELKRVLRPSGRLILSTPDHYVWQRLALSWDQHIKELTKQELLFLMRRFFTISDVYAQGLLKEEPIPKRIIRGFLNLVKRADYFGLRYKLLPSGFRKGLDNATSPIESGAWDLFPVADNQTGSHLIVVAKNVK
jgi:SAM-dependent methyltransferase